MILNIYVHFTVILSIFCIISLKKQSTEEQTKIASKSWKIHIFQLCKKYEVSKYFSFKQS